MKRTPILLILPLAATMATRTLAQQPRETPPPPVLIVSGNAQVEATPDEAAVRLGVVRQETTAQAAQEQTNRVAQAILAEMTKLGIPAARIRTSRLVLTPVYAPPRPDSRDAPRIVSYSASNQVSVDLSNLTQIGPVIDAGLRAGANQVDTVQFRLKDDLPVREQALKQAVAEARRKAETIAESLGVVLVGVLEVSEGGSEIAPRGEADGLRFIALTDATPTPVSPGQLEVSASVTVKYSIRAR
jgi:uncharacterized protein YggE